MLSCVKCRKTRMRIPHTCRRGIYRSGSSRAVSTMQSLSTIVLVRGALCGGSLSLIQLPAATVIQCTKIRRLIQNLHHHLTAINAPISAQSNSTSSSLLSFSSSSPLLLLLLHLLFAVTLSPLISSLCRTQLANKAFLLDDGQC